MSKLWTRVIICVFLFMYSAIDTCYAEVIYTFEEEALSTSKASEEVTVETSKISGDKWNLPYVTAHSAILMDYETGDILYNRDAHKRRPPASTTKILTAIVALEMAGLDEVSNISEKADRVGESSLYLNEGNKLKLGELIEGALVKSGNDACVAIAEQTAGSLDEFIRLMNLKAVSLGATDSHFVNPHGLPANDHYSSAYDLAVIARYALRNPMFSKFVSEKVATITYEEPQKTQIIKNTNKLLWNYPFADGVKTGTTNAAGKCLIASASKNGRKLISVVLNAPDRFGDAERLMEWGFNQTEIITIGNNGDFVTYYSGSGINIPVALGSDVVLCLPKDKTKELKFQAEFKGGSYPPIHKGDVLGTYNVLIGDTVIKSVQLISDQNYSGNPINFSGTLNLVVDRFLDLLNKKG